MQMLIVCSFNILWFCCRIIDGATKLMGAVQKIWMGTIFRVGKKTHGHLIGGQHANGF